MKDKFCFYFSVGAIASISFILLGQIFAAYAIARMSAFWLLLFSCGAIAICGGSSSWIAMFLGKDEEFTKQHGIVALIPVVVAILAAIACFGFGALAIGG